MEINYITEATSLDQWLGAHASIVANLHDDDLKPQWTVTDVIDTIRDEMVAAHERADDWRPEAVNVLGIVAAAVNKAMFAPRFSATVRYDGEHDPNTDDLVEEQIDDFMADPDAWAALDLKIINDGNSSVGARTYRHSRVEVVDTVTDETWVGVATA